MPEPNEYQLVRNLQTALAAIAVSGGYYFDVAAAAVKLDANQSVESLIAPDGPRPFIILEPEPETWDYAGSRPNRVKLTMPIKVHWVSEPTETTDEARLKTFFRGCADVERAIGQDITLGGIAMDTRLVNRTLEQVNNGVEVWAVVQLQIHLQRVYGLP